MKQAMGFKKLYVLKELHIWPQEAKINHEFAGFSKMAIGQIWIARS